MLLTLDMGNTNITIGVFDGDRLVLESRVATIPSKWKTSTPWNCWISCDCTA